MANYGAVAFRKAPTKKVDDFIHQYVLTNVCTNKI